MSNEELREPRACRRCGGPTLYRAEAMVPGDPAAPRGSRRAVAHPQPAWTCLSCGYLDPEERRTTRSAQRQEA